MNTVKLHYIYDPICGWCYGAAPLIAAAAPLIPIQLHAGGMMTGARRQYITPQLRNFIASHDAHIAQRSGQVFGAAYRDHLLHNSNTLLDSEIPSAAIIAFEQLGKDPNAGLKMLHALQIAHYIEGQAIADIDTVSQIAAELGQNKQRIEERIKTLITNDVGESPTQAHFNQTHRLMQELGMQGFPSMAIEHKGRFRKIDVGTFIGKTQAFADFLREIISQVSVQENHSTVDGENLTFCSVEACTR